MQKKSLANLAPEFAARNLSGNRLIFRDTEYLQPLRTPQKREDLQPFWKIHEIRVCLKERLEHSYWDENAYRSVTNSFGSNLPIQARISFTETEITFHKALCMQASGNPLIKARKWIKFAESEVCKAYSKHVSSPPLSGRRICYRLLAKRIERTFKVLTLRYADVFYLRDLSASKMFDLRHRSKLLQMLKLSKTKTETQQTSR